MTFYSIFMYTADSLQIIRPITHKVSCASYVLAQYVSVGTFSTGKNSLSRFLRQ